MYSHEHHLLAQAIFHERLSQADLNRRQHNQGRRVASALGAAIGRMLVAVGSRLQAFDHAQPAPATQR